MNKLRFLMPFGFLVVTAGFGAVVMLLWNWLMPTLFGVAVINYWQALGILALCRILFGSFSGSRHHRMNMGRREGMHGMHHIREKWMKMTPEQRQEFVNKRKAHFGRGGFFGEHFDFGEDTPKNND